MTQLSKNRIFMVTYALKVNESPQRLTDMWLVEFICPALSGPYTPTRPVKIYCLET